MLMAADILVPPAVRSPMDLTKYYSFCVAILPFFKPEIKDQKEYEAFTCQSEEDTSDYLQLIKKEKVFSALAYFATAMGMRYKPYLESTIKELSTDFAKLKGLIGEHNEAVFAPIIKTIVGWNLPSQGDEPLKKIDRDAREALAKKLCNIIIVELAALTDPVLRVYTLLFKVANK